MIGLLNMLSDLLSYELFWKIKNMECICSNLKIRRTSEDCSFLLKHSATPERLSVLYMQFSVMKLSNLK